MRNNKNTSKIIIAIAVALLATMISYSAFSNMHNQLAEQQKLIDVMQKTNKQSDNETYAYAVAVDNLKAGEIVADSDVDFKQFDIKNPNAFDNRSDIVNKVLLKDIQSGDTFTDSHIAKISSDDVSLREGYRALTLPADNFQGKSDKMKPGSCVDIYSSASDNDWILENVRIISFESDSNSPDKASSSITGANAITFEVSADSISDFISNISKGKLVLVVRGANDKKVSYKKHKTSGYNSNPFSSLPRDLPSSPPINSFPDNYSGLPQPIQPLVPQVSVEVIEANVKSKVTFD
ncbi:MAG: Flp pilus assembly protein CpaB [Candidatus Gastranaerophilales bacterium]|nr:Flp pilus assembly protein CpaB [Candidatus Gastranaerophilales bacterium]